MIFLTIGTHEPFDRLIRAVDDWAGQPGDRPEIFGQITAPGPESYRPRNFKWVDRLAPTDYAARFGAAALIISHAGMGSILTALQAGKPIVVMPRRGHLRETRNDHQYTTVRNLGDRPGIYVAEDETRLAEVLDRAVADLARASSAHRISAFAQPRLTQAIRNFILEKDIPKS